MSHRKSNRPPRKPAAASRPAPSRAPLPRWKKILFAAVACLFFLAAAEGLFALLGFKPILFDRDPYVGFSSRIPLFVKDTASATPGTLVTAKNKQRIFNLQHFTTPKPKGTYRIFCMGGSTTYGHPYEDPTSFAGWLRATLPKADPSRHWEVINCGGISYASYREALLMEELIQYEPDLFIVLSGQNEFLERRTYGEIISMPAPLRGLGAALSQTRIHAALKTVIDRAQGKPAARADSPNTLPAEVETMLERVVGPQAYHRDEPLHQQVTQHFRFNLARMTDIARSAGAPVIFINPASNLRNCAPFKSEHRTGLAEADLRIWQGQVQRARQFASSSQWKEALAAITQADAIDDRFADLHYFRGHALWQLQRHAEARAAFVRARDEDVCPLRALTPMIETVRSVAAERGAMFVDFEQLLDAKADHRVPGEDWFLDHVHPTIEGHRLLSLALLDTMTARGIVHPAANWNPEAALQIKREVEGRLTPQTHGTALLMLAKVLAWAGKHEEALRVSLRAISLSPDDAVIHFEAGKNSSYLERTQDAIRHLQKALELRPDFVEARSLLGSVLGQQGNTAEAVRQCRQALSRRPDDPVLHTSLGTALIQHGQTAEALTSFREAIRLSPGYAEAHSNLAWLLKDQGQLDEALQHFRECQRLKPGMPSPTIGLAWLLATHPNPAARNPKEAIQLAEKLSADSGYQNWMSLDTLAAAYAAAGRFDEAARMARRALPLAAGSSSNDVPSIEARLKLYQARQPFLESTAPPRP